MKTALVVLLDTEGQLWLWRKAYRVVNITHMRERTERIKGLMELSWGDCSGRRSGLLAFGRWENNICWFTCRIVGRSTQCTRAAAISKRHCTKRLPAVRRISITKAARFEWSIKQHAFYTRKAPMNYTGLHGQGLSLMRKCQHFTHTNITWVRWLPAATPWPM